MEKFQSGRQGSHGTLAPTPSSPFLGGPPNPPPAGAWETCGRTANGRHCSSDSAPSCRGPAPSPGGLSATASRVLPTHAAQAALVSPATAVQPCPQRACLLPVLANPAPAAGSDRPFSFQLPEAAATAPPPPRGSGFLPGSSGSRVMELGAADREQPARPNLPSRLAPGRVRGGGIWEWGGNHSCCPAPGLSISEVGGMGWESRLQAPDSVRPRVEG